MQAIHLFLWRHAEAEDSMPDLARPLTTQGRRDAARVARALAKRMRDNTRLVVSPALRARETAEPLVAKASLHVEIDQRLGPGTSTNDVLAALEDAVTACNGDAPLIVMVGHQPWIGQVARSLLTESEGDWSVKKAAAWWLVRRARGGSGEWQVGLGFYP
ncbi:MAG: SixA phosphatase family protein, partial [Burkholderiaceae bacterium]